MFQIIISLFLGATFVSGNALPNKFKEHHLADGRIIGGDLARIEDNPWQVSVGAFDVHNCGGSIIGPTTILTAAHCIDPENIHLFQVIAGCADLFNGTRLTIANVTVPEEYVRLAYDIALIELLEPLEFSETIQPIVLADVEPADGEVVHVSGWGVTSEFDPYTPNLLYSVDINIINREECNAVYTGIADLYVDDTMICAGVPDGGKDTCTGDAGGPLTYNNQLVGIVAWGYGCAEVGYPRVFTNVIAMRDWIKEHSGI